MQAKPKVLYETEDHQQLVVTEVLFAEHESKTREILVQNVIDLDIPHDPTVFPEEVVLIGYFFARDVHRIITKRTRPQNHHESSFIPTRVAGKDTVTVDSSKNGYL